MTSRVALVAHLSDLHLEVPSRRGPILDALVSALRGERERRGTRFDLVAVTGDVFDDGAIEPAAAANEYAALHSRIEEALGSRVPAIIVPGNHDRRRLGL